MAVDLNDNHPINGILGHDDHWSENSSLRQLHLNRKCELVHSEEAESMEMEADMQTNRKEAILEVPTSFVFLNTFSSEHCSASALPSFGLNFGRNSGALSPADSAAVCFENRSHETVDQPMAQGSRNAFSLLMGTSHIKSGGCSQKSHCQACHNCRTPVSVRSVMKCQFCEHYVCTGCMRQCQGCFLHFCQLCSVVNYDQVSERSFCLSCSGR